MKKDDLLLVAELSRLGRNMLEVLNLINELNERGVKIIFVCQPELSTTGPYAKLLVAIYSYFAETERHFISIRTKLDLATAKAGEVTLGRPKGSPNKERVLDLHKTQIKHYLELGLNLTLIQTIINNQLEKPINHILNKVCFALLVIRWQED